MKTELPRLSHRSSGAEMNEVAHQLYQRALMMARDKGAKVTQTRVGVGYTLNMPLSHVADEIWHDHRTGKPKTAFNALRAYIRTTGMIKSLVPSSSILIAPEWDVPNPEEVMDLVREEFADQKAASKQRTTRRKMQATTPASGNGDTPAPDDALREVEREVEEDAAKFPRPHNLIPDTVVHADGSYECTLCGRRTDKGSGASAHHRNAHEPDRGAEAETLREQLEAIHRVMQGDGIPPDGWTLMQSYVTWLEQQVAAAQVVDTTPSDAEIRCQLIEDALGALGRGESTMTETLRNIKEALEI